MQISAFVDGELPEAEAQLLVRRLSQDAELRQQAGEYFAIGRALRGQASVAAMGDLRGRITAALEDRLVDQEFDAIEPVSRRYGRPLAGFAIAATVAVAAIFGLQQMTLQSGAGADETTPAIAEGVVDDAYTVPEIDYFERHNNFKSEAGNNNFDYRRVSADVDEDAEEIDPPVEIESETEAAAE